MGSVRQKAWGSWEARYRDPEGHPRGKSFPTKKAANEFLARVAVDVQRGEHISPDNARRPLGPIAEEWIASLYHVKPKTLMNYENTLRYHVLPRLGETPVGAIDQRRVRRFFTDMLGDGVSPGAGAQGRRQAQADSGSGGRARHHLQEPVCGRDAAADAARGDALPDCRPDRHPR